MLISPTKFDLIAAGYRDALVSLGDGRELDLTENRTAAELAGQLSGFHDTLPTVRFDGVDDTMLLRGVTKDVLTHFGNAVRDQGAWRHLYDDRKRPAHELQHQSLFRIFANMSLQALEVKVHPGANHGAGATDITLTLNDETHVIEFKKDRDKTSLTHGLVIQLPLYLRAAKAQSGAYVVMRHKYDPHDIFEFLKDVLAKNDLPPAIDVMVIDCRRQETASVA